MEFRLQYTVIYRGPFDRESFHSTVVETRETTPEAIVAAAEVDPGDAVAVVQGRVAVKTFGG